MGNDPAIMFMLNGEPPTATAQQKRCRIVGGRPKFFESDDVRAARERYMAQLAPYRPERPLDGPVTVHIMYLFQPRRGHPPGAWKTTRPDVDNMGKLLLDCMTASGFWGDDSQVVSLTLAKAYGGSGGIAVMVDRAMEEAQ